MVRSLLQIEEDIRALNTSDQEELLRVLLEQLDSPPDSNVEAAWLEEVERRGREIDSHAVDCIPGDQVFAEIDALLKR